MPGVSEIFNSPINKIKRLVKLSYRPKLKFTRSNANLSFHHTPFPPHRLKNALVKFMEVELEYFLQYPSDKNLLPPPPQIHLLIKRIVKRKKKRK